jgi:signal transduction histidine kinase
MAVVLLFTYGDLLRAWLAVGLVFGAFVFTALTTVWLKRSPEMLTRPGPVVAELMLATGLVVCDGWAYGAGHAFSSSQSLGSVWPLVAVLSTGVAFGLVWGSAAGVVLGVGRLGSTLANGVRDFDSGRVLSLINSGVFYVVAGAVSGYLMWLLMRAEREISAARAREGVARTLHDGVLQTLAVVERRSTDVDLVRLAREQDRELRRFLFGDGQASAHPRDLGVALRDVAARFERNFSVPVEVLVPFDLPPLAEEHVGAISGAVGEALTNAGKHAQSRRLTVFVEPDDDDRIFCSVKDDGIGFDVASVPQGVGITRSIAERMVEVGGRAEVRSRPGHGTEVCLWL